MTVWVDADSCPARVREIVARAATRRGFSAVYVANRDVPRIEEADVAQVTYRVVTPPDTADEEILRRAQPGDLVITRDIPLAERSIEAGLAAMNDRGTLWNRDTVRERRSVRDTMAALRAGGLVTDARRTYGKRDVKLFADSFDAFLRKNLSAP